jgi:drug/metabolite transporter (DMT)-like permease
VVAAYVYLQPVFATIGAAVLLDERLGPRIVGSGAIVLFGVWVAARTRPGVALAPVQRGAAP